MEKKRELSEGLKYDEDKLRFDLLPPKALELLAEVYTSGAKKYEDRNMEMGMSWGRVFGAAMRHLWAFWRGEDKDAESGLYHLAHAAWCCLTLLDYVSHKQFKKFDDRAVNGSVRLKEQNPRKVGMIE